MTVSVGGIILGLLCGLMFPRTSSFAGAQEIRLSDGTSLGPVHAEHVHLGSESFALTAEKADWIAIRFEVDSGFHINSHTPHDELLIPTDLHLQVPPGVKIVAEDYPAGVPLQLQAGSGETLSTYQGEFRVRVRLFAPKGEFPMTGSLRYQACDQHSCFPPRTLPVRLAISAR